MRISAVLVAIFISNIALASATVGDFAYYVGSVVSNCGSKMTSIESLSEIKYADADFVKIRNQLRENNGSISFTETIIQASDFIDGKDLKDFYALKKYCSQFKSTTMEKISVIAGSFWTCHMNSTIGDISEETWVGGVALGVVKFKASQSEFNDPKCFREVSWELKNFSFGGN